MADSKYNFGMNFSENNKSFYELSIVYDLEKNQIIKLLGENENVTYELKTFDVKKKL